MDLVTPSIGLIFWTLVSFLILLMILKKFAWKPILQSIHERERSIEEALSKAQMAKEELLQVTQENESLLKQARIERDEILNQAKELKDQIIKDARVAAQEEGAKMIDKAKLEIESQKNAAMAEVKTQVSELSLQIAEKILRKQFDDQTKQQELITDLLKEVKLN